MFNIFRKPSPKMSLTCVLEKDDATGEFTAHFEEFPDTYAQGRTEKEAINNIKEALVSVLMLEAKEKVKKQYISSGEKISTMTRHLELQIA